ncbi:hypothetical protein MHI32_01380 [Paenibacillus sp. FSL H7-0690]|uniref:hypothetical protein n=1 Tax=Paenibacillus sp. FSL H7-0690 TaxID=2921437 RepID=UPI0030ECE2AE
MGEFFIHFVLPFVMIAILYLIWAYSANRLKDKFPKYFQLCGRINNHLPKIIAFGVIVWFLYYYWGLDQIRF